MNLSLLLRYGFASGYLRSLNSQYRGSVANIKRHGKSRSVDREVCIRAG